MSPSRAMTRRQFLVATAAFAGAAAVGCTDAEDAADDRLRILSWADYIDPETVPAFQDETGLAVDYADTYPDNYTALEEIFRPNLGEGEPTGFDVIVPTYWVVDRLLAEGWLEPLPIELVPNHVNIDPDLLGMPWDRGARFHMPWQVGITGIAYIPERVGRELEAIEDLFAPDLAGRVGMVQEMRESVGLVMLTQGADPSRATRDAAERALQRIEQATADGQVNGFTSNFEAAFTTQGLAACLAWSGDVVQLQQAQPELGLEFVIPVEGAIRWFDSMIIPAGAANVAGAARWMDFVYEPANAARITVGVQYISPVLGVRDELAQLGGEAAALASNPILFPDDETRRRLFFWSGLDAAAEDELDRRFADLIQPHVFGE